MFKIALRLVLTCATWGTANFMANQANKKWTCFVRRTAREDWAEFCKEKEVKSEEKNLGFELLIRVGSMDPKEVLHQVRLQMA